MNKTTITYYYLSLCWWVIFPGLWETSSVVAQSERKPNVVLILTDDQGYGDLSIHGNPYLQTPVLDQFAKEGIRLDRFYVSPLCAPTRASLLTGRYHPRTGTRWVSGGLENMHGSEITIAEVFKKDGYSTACFGKWHNGAHYPFHPNQQGFDEFVGFCSGHWYTYFNTTLQKNSKPYPTEGYISDVLTDEALSFIEAHREEPFFCYIPYNAPHGPFQVPDNYYDRNLARLSHLTDSLDRRKTAAVYGMCENIDDNVGRILDKLEELSLREETIVVFLTDNGPNGHRFNGEMRGIKGSVHEGGVRVPCFIQWPGRLAGGQLHLERMAHIDLLPTLSDLCGISLPETLSLDGMSLAGMFTEHPDPSLRQQLANRPIFSQNSAHEFMPYKGAIRTAHYRWVLEGDKEGLFDMKKDPSQQKDLSKEKVEMANQLKEQYMDWFREMEAALEDQTLVPIGLEGQEEITLPAHESSFVGNIEFREGHGWAHDWIVNWTGMEDTIFWKVDTHSAGEWIASIKYTTSANDVGTRVRLHAGKNHKEGEIIKAFDPEEIIGNDRIPRIETYEKEWATVELGPISIDKGTDRLFLTAEEIPGMEVGHLKALVLKRVQ